MGYKIALTLTKHEAETAAATLKAAGGAVNGYVASMIRAQIWAADLKQTAAAGTVLNG